jgi:hypothetical protein
VLRQPELDGPGLHQLGLPADEATTYLALLRQPGAGPAELAPVTGLAAGTIARVLATLMTRLGARTRLQAGVQGIRQGWL